MATKKNYNHKKRSMKKYSIVEKLEYHSKRQGVPGRFGLNFGDPKQCYSMGFREAFTGRNNEDSVKREFGKRSSNAYSVGYKRGKKAARTYFDKTGKQPFDLALEIGKKAY